MDGSLIMVWGGGGGLMQHRVSIGNGTSAIHEVISTMNSGVLVVQNLKIEKKRRGTWPKTAEHHFFWSKNAMNITLSSPVGYLT